MSSRHAVKIVRSDAPQGMEQEWNDWFNNQYILSRLRLPGFLSACKFDIYDGGPPCYMTVFELDGVDALTSDSYLKLRDIEAKMPPDSFESRMSSLPNFSCGIYEQIYPEKEYSMPDAPVVFAAGIDVPVDKEEEFNAWYNTDHIAALEKVPGFITARRFAAVQSPLHPLVRLASSGPKYLALYDIASEDVLKSPAFFQAARSPWTTWVHSWYTRRFRLAGRRIYSRQNAHGK